MIPIDLTVAIAVTNAIFCKGISGYIRDFEGYSIVYETTEKNRLVNVNDDLKRCLDICILDSRKSSFSNQEQFINKFRKYFPSTKIIMFIGAHEEAIILNMFDCGVHCLLPYDIDSNELRIALQSLQNCDNYYHKLIVPALSQVKEVNTEFTQKERLFIQLCCTELTYKEIADRMQVSTRSVDLLRENLFKRYDVISRIGLAMKMLKNKIVSI